MDKETYKKVVEIFTRYSLWIDGEGECIVNDDYDNLANDLFVLFGVSNRSKTKKVSSDGVFFRCDNCGFEPQMASSTDDLLIMHFCPKCGSEFE